MLAQMDQWRASRWGANAGASLVGRFERMLAQRLAPHGTLRLSEFSENGRPLSVMLNVRMAGTEYYLASAFDPARGSGLSPGYLHFGYAIEAACADGVARFDLLAGRGRHRDYKVDFGPREEPLVSWQLVRAPVLRGLYGLHGFVRRADP
jgi:CelD/BcsL family acetyltransferase involved in cellulose biosynthesis